MKPKQIKKIRCKDAAKYICENLDEPNNSQLCREIKKHLKSCPDCEATLSDIKRVVTLYQKTPTPRLSSSAEKRLLKTLKIHL
jgi:hypothetical protein